MSDISEPITPKINPEDLEIRAKPRPVTRINRKVLYLLSGTGLILIFGATIFALNPPSIFDKNPGGNELYNIDNKPSVDGLEGLPRKYSDLSKPPELGSPLPGDLGSAIIKIERDLGIPSAPALPFRPNPVEDAERAERIRQARLAQQGRESGVFFQLTLRNSGALPDTLTKLATAPTNASTGNLFSAISAAGSSANAPRQLNQNLQGRKLDFLNQKADGKIYNPHKLQTSASPYQVMAGTIISASLITGINSDLPGNVIAQVTENIYDTATGGHLLIPQGSRMMGTYDSVVAFGQERALLVWQRIILPDGSSIVIDNLPGTDTAGYAGLEDKVNFHTWKLLKGIVLSTLLGVSTELTFGDQESDLLKAIRESAQDSANQVGQSLTERNLNIQPTITIRQGWPLRIIVNKDMILRPYIMKGAIR